MGFGQNLLVFAFIGAIILFLFGYNTTALQVAQVMGIDLTNGQFTVTGTFYASLAIILGLSFVTIIAGTFAFPNPYIIFAGMATFIVFLSTVYYDMLQSTGAPFEVKLLIGGVLGFLIIMSGLVFIKGGEW